jgi:hypothetical protein
VCACTATDESLLAENLVTDVRHAFATALTDWWEANVGMCMHKWRRYVTGLGSAATRDDEDVLSTFADYLTQHFLCDRLDPLPPSTDVTFTRKCMAKIIEDFSSEGLTDKAREPVHLSCTVLNDVRTEGA